MYNLFYKIEWILVKLSTIFRVYFATTRFNLKKMTQNYSLVIPINNTKLFVFCLTVEIFLLHIFVLLLDLSFFILFNEHMYMLYLISFIINIKCIS